LLAPFSPEDRKLIEETMAVYPGLSAHGRAKYPGLHSLRHLRFVVHQPARRWRARAAAQGWCKPALGHASIQMTADTYGHLFPRGDDGSELAQAERALLG
jgi:integrase